VGKEDPICFCLFCATTLCIPHWVIYKQHYFSTVLEAGKSKIRVLASGESFWAASPGGGKQKGKEAKGATLVLL
jgi:hypothetical protein